MRIAFFGDSLTEGRDGASYLHTLRARVADDVRLRTVALLNAGVGGDTIYNLARRIDRDITPLAPDWVVIFIGSNDCTTGLLRHRLPTPQAIATLRYFSCVKGIRNAITPARFTDGLRIVIDALARRTPARIALCTPAIYGEAPGSRAWRLLDQYVDVVRWVGSERGCPVIDVRGAITHALATMTPRSPLAPLLSLRTRLHRNADIETLARLRGYRFTYDGIHLTTAGAAIVADTIYDWLSETVAPQTESLC